MHRSLIKRQISYYGTHCRSLCTPPPNFHVAPEKYNFRMIPTEPAPHQSRVIIFISRARRSTPKESCLGLALASLPNSSHSRGPLIARYFSVKSLVAAHASNCKTSHRTPTRSWSLVPPPSPTHPPFRLIDRTLRAIIVYVRYSFRVTAVERLPSREDSKYSLASSIMSTPNKESHTYANKLSSKAGEDPANDIFLQIDENVHAKRRTIINFKHDPCPPPNNNLHYLYNIKV